MPDDDVQLTDLAVIQQFSLAVRGAAATRSEVIAALESDLAYLNGARRRAATAPSSMSASVQTRTVPSSARPAVERLPAKKSSSSKTTSPTSSKSKSPAKKSSAKSAVRKAPAKATRGRRG